jgi:hypothetical protein
MAASARATPTELSTPEVALLAMTNPRKPLASPQSRLALTTKESYIWATFLASLAEAELLADAELGEVNKQPLPERFVNTLKEEIEKAAI